jgi:hypothetical protein
MREPLALRLTTFFEPLIRVNRVIGGVDPTVFLVYLPVTAVH